MWLGKQSSQRPVKREHPKYLLNLRKPPPSLQDAHQGQRVVFPSCEQLDFDAANFELVYRPTPSLQHHTSPVLTADALTC